MKKTSGRRAIGEILNMLYEEEHITEDFKHFIDQCLSDYLWNKKLSYSLYGLIKYNPEIVDIPKVNEALSESTELTDSEVEGK
jgi:hypothetical protein